MSNTRFQEWVVKVPYLQLDCQLGEGPYYEKETQSLRFVDIRAKAIHWVSLHRGPDSHRTIELDVSPSVTCNIAGHHPSEKILVGVKYGVAILDCTTHRYKYVHKINPAADNPRLRTNDGAVDPEGRLLLGTMSDFDLGSPELEGSLLRFGSLDGPPEELMSGLAVPNGIGWSPDKKLMYFVNSSKRQILVFDYSAAPSGIPFKVFYQHHENGGEPDGLRVDSEGHVWVAIWGESCVLRISPDGLLVGKVLVPTRFVTCPQFVGEELFITTARDDEEDGQDVAYGGSVFRVHVGITGLDPFLYKLPDRV